MKHFVYITCIVGAVVTALPAFAQNINSMETRLDRMEREMATLSRSVYKGDVPPPNITVSGGMDQSQLASFEMRMNQMDEQLRRLTGMIEENSYRLRKLEQAGVAASNQPAQLVQPQNSYMVDTSGSSMNEGVSGMASVGDPEPLTVDNTPYRLGTIRNNNQTDTPAGLYDQAFSYLQTDDYASAQNAFQDFIDRYPDHSLAANSKYWLGETYYARNDYESASRAFARAFKDHPEGQKAPDTLLKLAMSLKGQGMGEEACLTLSELDNRFPNAPSSVKSKASEERTSYGCD